MMVEFWSLYFYGWGYILGRLVGVILIILFIRWVWRELRK
jgi:hypothetical protein